MSVDYKELCLELFGTTDVDELRDIAKKNNRGAGRKKRFTDKQIEKIYDMQAHGVSQQKIAEYFGVSRQTISKYLKNELDDHYNYQIDFMYKTSVCTTILVNFWDKKIKIINKTNDILHRAFGVNETPNWDDFNEFILDRCFSEARGNKKEILKSLNIDSYDPIQIVEQTKGKTYEDNQWIKFTKLEQKSPRF